MYELKWTVEINDLWESYKVTNNFFGGYSVSIVRIWYSLSVSLTFWVMILKKKSLRSLIN